MRSPSTYSALTALVMSLCSASNVFSDTYTYASVDDLPKLDHAYGTRHDDLVYASLVCDALFEIADNGEPSPLAAQSWTLSEDKTRLNVTLRNDLTWSDGTAITAQDFVTGFRRVVDPSLTEHPRPDYLLEPIVNASQVSRGEAPLNTLGVRALDELTLEFQLVQPTAYFLSILSYPALCAAPTHLVEGSENWRSQLPLTSSGPYQVTESAEDFMRFTRRTDHWFSPEFEEIIFRRVESQDLAARELRAGKADVSKEISGPSSEWVRNDPSLEARTHILAATTYGVFNTLDERFADKNVRYALNLLLERNQIARSAQVKGAVSFTPPLLLGETSSETGATYQKSRSERVKKAREMLRAAGYSSESPLEVTISMISLRQYDATSNAILSSWNIPEVRATRLNRDPERYSSDLRHNRYEFALAEWIGDYPDPMTFLSLLRSGGSKNHSDWGNADFDALLDEAMAETDREARQAMYQTMEEILLEHSPITPLFHPTRLLIRNKSVLEPPSLSVDLNPRYASRKTN